MSNPLLRPGLRRTRGRLAAVLTATALAAIAVVATSASGSGGGPASRVAHPAGITSEPYGTAPNGAPVTQYTLTNANGMVVKILDWGGIITDIEVPDRAGTFASVTLALTSLVQYGTESPYFGAIIGRYANRIANHS